MTKRPARNVPIFTWALIMALALAACGPLPAPTAAPLPTRTRTGPSETLSPPPEITPSITPGGPLTLRVWVPPEFDPAQDTPAAALLRARLQEFTALRPRMTIDVRVKALNGPGGLLDALTTTGPAAPGVLPDLIALPRDLLEAAALKGLINPYDPAVIGIAADDWYPYAAELARLQDSIYGLPFAGDALALVYRPDKVAQVPASWEAVGSGGSSLVFPAADPQALFTLAMYQSQGGKIEDEAGKPALETIVLTDVLTYYAEAQVTTVMTDGLIQLQSHDQVWTAFIDNNAPMAGTWTSRYLTFDGTAEGAAAVAPLPTEKGEPFTLATGWVWALPVRNPERQRVAVELARFLTEGDFLSTWSQAAGYLPPYPAALQGWEDEPARPILDRISRSAHALPPSDILVALSGPLWQATVDVLKGQVSPIPAAQRAASSLSGP